MFKQTNTHQYAPVDVSFVNKSCCGLNLPQIDFKVPGIEKNMLHM